ncbi:2TM domain-containing protein [Undibacterium sp. TJN25]|uniref:2TM domain-containing protein n=1 Tax=Undibacterium sp. TJN25 TaxID=3413056 RepID=UPI003BF00ABA
MQTTVTYEQAKRQVERKIGLMTHAAVFVLVNAGLMLLNMQLGRFSWSAFPLFGWGIGLVFHALSVIAHAPGNSWKQRMIQHELNK